MAIKTFTILSIAMISAEKYEVTVKGPGEETKTLPASATAVIGLPIGAKVKLEEDAATFPEGALQAKKHSPSAYAVDNAH